MADHAAHVTPHGIAQRRAVATAIRAADARPDATSKRCAVAAADLGALAVADSVAHSIADAAAIAAANGAAHGTSIIANAAALISGRYLGAFETADGGTHASDARAHAGSVAATHDKLRGAHDGAHHSTLGANGLLAYLGAHP